MKTPTLNPLAVAAVAATLQHQATAAAPEPEQKPDIQLFNAGQTIELLSQLLGATLRKLAKATNSNPEAYLIVTQADIDGLVGCELQHGDHPDGIAIRVAPIGAQAPA